MVREIIIGDFGKDLDDENALLYAVGAQKHGDVQLLGVVANLIPSEQRARLARGMLDLLEVDAPVAAGTSCNVTGKLYDYEMDVPYLAPETPESNGIDLLPELLDASEGKSTLVLNSGMTDAAELLDTFPKLVHSKVERIAIMGGVQVKNDEVILDGHGRMLPDSAANNMFDPDAAAYLYERAQAENIPLTVVTREAAYGCKFHLSFYEELAATGNPIGSSLLQRERPGLTKLWHEANAPADSELRGSLPARCDRQWFVDTFLAGEDPGDAPDIWGQAVRVGEFQLYDSLNVAAVTRREFFNPTPVEVHGIEHNIVGVSKINHGIKNIPGLRRHVQSRELDALRMAPASNK